jgi:hypothetical protein
MKFSFGNIDVGDESLYPKYTPFLMELMKELIPRFVDGEKIKKLKQTLERFEPSQQPFYDMANSDLDAELYLPIKCALEIATTSISSIHEFLERMKIENKE